MFGLVEVSVLAARLFTVEVWNIFQINKRVLSLPSTWFDIKQSKPKCEAADAATDLYSAIKAFQ